MGKLYLSQLTLSHFRSHKRAVVECDARPVAIFGPNGAGKTNLIEAVSLLSPGRGLRRASAEDMTRRPEALGWKLTAILHSLHQAHEIEVWSEGGNARQVRIDGKAAPQTALGRIARVLWLIPAMDRLWIEGAEGRRRFLDRMTLSFLPDHAEHALSYEKAMRERNRLLKDMVREPSWYAALERRMAEAGAAIHAGRLEALKSIAEAQEQAQTAFPAATLSLECDMPADADGLQTALADNRTRDLAAGRTLIGPHRADLFGVYAAKGIPAKDCSTGEQKALLVSLILANARALAKDFGAPPLLLLDEVAAHLDADRQAALYDEICSLGAQAWMTGTGAEMFAALGDRTQVLEVTEEAGESRVAVGR
ncbi:DNA replication/repair protein RecF [Sulfitobacter mediterraneus]|uniref:DNA replication/repair protein RecF n=1 Tax=Sulfitobacter mediterraneus TaxID=83219 RepID=UPI00193A01D2|nr:DNA replication/repair protein RecF [Sulfitobacter mediterraneus]MBM1555278.1 DNA replication/repair protein RecF [Sulfitobacter mediterraneus]MBM1567169.1 DNA replication/repair protein RecF [Sulfitobacter mediterraneus]MBM1570971.1 DNA replication/repair protein RecF [Sulfitobacter mediterraneus]MBM1574771.1 DNA replication/repair protein RecF [Sulfitobacter mediterraneus]MBM1578236.1 DNA replication/repair protein RecF [Sulfitobacter mediterraneus]